MGIPRIYLKGPTHFDNSIISLPAELRHRLLKVLRLRVGDKLFLFSDGIGDYLAELTHIEPQLAVTIREAFPKPPASPFKITLAPGLLPSEKMDWVIQKSVELGVASICPLLTQFSKIHLKADRMEKRMQHWQGVILHAVEQCGRIELPTLENPISLNMLLSTPQLPIYYLDPKAANFLLNSAISPSKMVLIVGPEGGLSPEELRSLKAYGAVGARLGPRILRTETAPLTALSLLQAQFGDLRD